MACSDRPEPTTTLQDRDSALALVKALRIPSRRHATVSRGTDRDDDARAARRRGGRERPAGPIKGRKFRLDRDYDRLGYRGRDCRLRGRANQRRASQSCGDDRAGDGRQLSLVQGPRVRRCADDRRVCRRDAGLADLPAALESDARPWRQVGGVLYRTRDRPHRRQSALGDRRHRGAAVRNPGHRRQRAGAVAAGRRESVGRFQSGTPAAAGWRPGTGHRRFAWRPDGIRDQSRARPGTTVRTRGAADRGKGGSNWRYAWIPVVGPIVGGIIGAALYSIVGF